MFICRWGWGVLGVCMEYKIATNGGCLVGGRFVLGGEFNPKNEKNFTKCVNTSMKFSS